MLDLLLVTAIVIPSWYAYKRSVAHGLVAINHVSTFTFGFLLYWITPIVVGVFGSRFASRLSIVYFGLFDKRVVVAYLTACVALYLCFILGDSLAVCLCHDRLVLAPRIPRLALSLVTMLGCVLTFYTCYTLRAELLLPYGTGLTAKTARGTVTSCVVLLGVVSLMYTLDRPKMLWRERLVNRYSVPFFCGCMLLLWMGSRLYAASFFVMFAVYHSNFQKRLRLRTVLLVATSFTIVLASVAIWRSHTDVSDAVVIVVQEPVLTSLSLVQYLGSRGIAWTNSPKYLASDFSNLIPALILPGKAALRKRPPVYSPLGAMNSFVSFNINFGIVGSAVFLFFLPIAFRALKSRSSGTLFATMYVMCVAWMAFTFFRDPFFISLIKAILQDSVVMPLCIVALGRLLTAACMPAGRTVVLPEPEIGAP